MKKTLFTLLISSIICLPFLVKAQQVIITDDAAYTTPASGSMLDVKSTNKGFMPPRVALTSLNDASTIASPTTGLMVYNTGVAALNDKGIYYWNGTIWVKALSGGIDGTNYMAIADDGTVSLKGNATVWNDIVVPPFSTYFGVDNYPSFVQFKNGIKTFTFDDKGAGLEQQVYFSIQMPHNWKEGTTIFPHVHWSPQTAKSGNVVWGFEYTWAEYDSTTPVAFPTPTIVTATTGVSTNGVDTHYITSFAPITPTTSQDKISGILMCRFFRNSSNSADTYTNGSAALLSFDIHYEIDAFGSGTEFIK